MENNLDRLLCSCQEVAIIVKEIEKMGFTKDQAINIVRTGVENIRSENKRDINDTLKEISNTLDSLNQK